MRAVQFAAFGNPAEVLSVVELPTPRPGPGQVRVRLRVRPINPSDLFAIRGQYGTLPQLPATPGFESSGVVDALGDGVTSLQPGQLVIPFSTGGTWQECVIVPAEQVIPVPAGIDERQAAMVLANPTSAWLLLHEELKAQPGSFVLQNAANSAVGRHVIQLSRRAGIHTINIVRRRDVIAELLETGADHVICEADEDVAARVRAITGGKGAHGTLDSVSGPSGSRLAALLRPGGTQIVYGAISGKPLTLDAGALLFRGITVRGWWLSHWYRVATPAQIAALFGNLFPLIADGTLHAPVAAEFDLAEVQQAVAMAEGSARNGKVLLVG